MPNLILNYNCNNSCEFCFADKAQDHELKIEQMDQLHKFVNSFRKDSVNIMGGEPTLNKDFFAIVNFLISQNQKVNVFTNGNIPPNQVDKLKLLSNEYFSFCVNRSLSRNSREITHLYKTIGHMIMLSLTIYKQKQEYRHIFAEINTYKLQKTYRLGIAAPSLPDKNNVFVSPGQYEVISAEIIGMIEEGLDYGIKPSFDCGFPYCFFDEDQKKFLNINGIDFKSYCGIIPDICPDNTVVPCLPLKNITQDYSGESKWEDIKLLLEDRLKQYQQLPLFEKCLSCKEISSGNCPGGCAALRLVM